MLISILRRDNSEGYISLCKKVEVPFALSLFGRGTANSEILSLLGLDNHEKTIVITVADKEKTEKILKYSRNKLFIDIPGNGIVISSPLKSVGGLCALEYLTDKSIPDNSKPNFKFDYELLVVIINEGYTDQVMEIARSAGADGGTVLHAKGTGFKHVEKFFSVSLAEEKELLLIVTKTSQKQNIMHAIATEAGPKSEACSIVLSLPVSDVAGMKLIDDEVI